MSVCNKSISEVNTISITRLSVNNDINVTLMQNLTCYTKEKKNMQVSKNVLYFQQLLLQYSVSHDRPKIILRFGVQETFLTVIIIIIEYYYYKCVLKSLAYRF